MLKIRKVSWFAGLMGLLLISVFTVSVDSQETTPLLLDKDIGSVVSGLDSTIPGLLKKGRVPGLQIALIRDGRTVWTGAYGIKNAESSDAVTSETIFEAASLTKPFFAYYVMMLVDEGTIDLDTSIMEYLPREEIEKLLPHPLDQDGFRFDWFEKITTRHVLSHSSGLPHGDGGNPVTLFFEPGTEYKYSAEGYYYLQKAVEHLKGKKLEVLMKENVIDPLGMTHSCMVWRDEYENTMSNGHDANGRPQDFRKRSNAHAGASLYTTAADYALFVRAVMNGEGLSKETAKEMLTPQVKVDKDQGLDWSLGFALQEDSNGKAFWQWGDYGIFRNYIIAYLEEGSAVVYLANSFFGLSICGDLVEESIGGRARGNEFLEYLPWDSPIYSFVWKVSEKGPGSVNELLVEMTNENPEMLSDRGIAITGYMLTDGGKHEEAIAFYNFVCGRKPESAGLRASLARAYLESGDLESARNSYLKALETTDRKDFDSTSVDWALSFIGAFESPLELSPEHLEKLAGDYGPRHIKYEDGKLYYFRDSSGAADYRELFPMSEDTFVARDLIYFRIHFDLDKNGMPIAIVGLYEGGYEDRSPRDK
jgi:CubicO group peptidase (beta-lactamase class C family)